MSDLSGDFSGDLDGIWLVVYELAGALSRAFLASSSAASAINFDVFGLVVGVLEFRLGLSGNGAGERAGSELSHLQFPTSVPSA